LDSTKALESFTATPPNSTDRPAFNDALGTNGTSVYSAWSKLEVSEAIRFGQDSRHACGSRYNSGGAILQLTWSFSARAARASNVTSTPNRAPPSLSNRVPDEDRL